MWIASKYGFFSIVKSSQVNSEWMIRGRVKNDLALLKEAVEISSEILETLDSDYRYRLIVNQAELSQVMNAFSAIDYSNFKGHIATLPEQRHKLDAYHRIWSIMYQTQQTNE
jgi:hypothetical protein